MPDWSNLLRSRLSSLRLRPEREQEIIEELSQHLQERYEDLVSGGHGQDEARRLAMDELLEQDALADQLGSLRQAASPPQAVPGQPGGSVFSDLFQDLGLAVRMLRKQPGFAAAAILTLAFGLGANGAIFSLVDATLLRPLPFPNAERLAVLFEHTQTSRRGSVAPLNLTDWNARSRSFDVIAGFIPVVGGMVLSNPSGQPETISRQWVTAGFFDVLGVKPILGRTFLSSDDARRSKAVVLSEAFWRSRFGTDAGIVGRDLRLDGKAYTVVGVVPQGLQVFGQTNIWALVSIQGASPVARSRYVFQVIGRLKSGVTLSRARSDMAAVADGLAREFPQTNQGRRITIEPMRDVVIGSDLRLTSLLFLGVVGFVLLICSANVANLLLARGVVRAREMAIRYSLGASRFRVIRQLVAESLVLSVAGGLLGLVLGVAILKIAPVVVPAGLLPPAVTLNFDWRVSSFCFATALLAGLLCGVAPAWQVSGLSPALVMASSSRTTTGRSGKVRELLVVGEVTTAVILLFCAGLLLRTLLTLENVDRGYRAQGVLTMMVDPLGSKYPSDDALMQFYQTVEQEVRSIPGVRNIAWTTTLPLGPSDAGRVFFETVGGPAAPKGQIPTAEYQIVSPSYFHTVELPVIAGRAIEDHDRRESGLVCMVDEEFVRKYSMGRSPVGLKLSLRPVEDEAAPARVREIIGVVRHVKGRPDEAEGGVQIYVPLAQDTMDDVYMVVRPESGDAAALAPAVRAAVARVDTQQLVGIRDVMTLDDVAWEGTARHRFRAALVITFAVLALLLAMVGLFGILAYSVQQRTRDFGIRRTLGATTRDLLQLVIRNAARMIAIGVVLGLGLSALAGRLLTSMLFGVSPLDPMTFVLVASILAITGIVSIAGPAWRAARIDPVVALHDE